MVFCNGTIYYYVFYRMRTINLRFTHGQTYFLQMDRDRPTSNTFMKTYLYKHSDLLHRYT